MQGRGIGMIGTPALLASCLCVSACQQHASSADAYVWTDDQTPQQLHVSTLDGRELAKPAIGDVVSADLRGANGALCAYDDQRMLWHVPKAGAAADAHLFATDGVGSADPHHPQLPPLTRADVHQQCLFPAAIGQLGVLSAALPHGQRIPLSTKLAWSGLDYVGAIDAVALIGNTRFAIVHDTAHLPAVIKTVTVHGQAMGLSVQRMSCCGRLAPDGHTLYAVAEATDSSDETHTVLAAFNDDGGIRQIYLPSFDALPDCQRISASDDRNDCEQHARYPSLNFYDGARISLEQGEGQRFAMSPDGRTLYVRAIVQNDSRNSEDEQSQVVAIDTYSGTVRPLPLFTWSAMALTSSGNYLLVQNASAHALSAGNHHPDGLSAYRVSDGKLLPQPAGRHLLGSWLESP